MMSGRIVAAFALFAAVTCMTPTATAQSWKPTRNVEIIVGSAAGGGADLTARLMQRIFQERLVTEAPVVVVNRPGGGSALSYVYLNQHPADAHYIALSLQPMITGPIIGQGQVSYTDMTPLAQLFNEYVGFAVKPDSPIKSGAEVIDRLRRDPGALSIALSTALGGSNHLATAVALKAAGVDIRRLRIVVVKGAGEAITGVMGGHYDIAAVSTSSLIPHLSSGKLRGIAVSGPRRVTGAFADVPTWTELGAKGVYANWRGVVGPKGMTPPQVAYWDGVLLKLSQLPDWRESLAKSLQDPDYMDSRETRRFLAQQQVELRGILVELGLVR